MGRNMEVCQHQTDFTFDGWFHGIMVLIMQPNALSSGSPKWFGLKQLGRAKCHFKTHSCANLVKKTIKIALAFDNLVHGGLLLSNSIPPCMADSERAPLGLVIRLFRRNPPLPFPQAHVCKLRLQYCPFINSPTKIQKAKWMLFLDYSQQEVWWECYRL